MSDSKTATIHRMVMDSHTCPYGLKALHLLKSRGYRVEDHHLTNRDQTDAFKAEHGVKTTPQMYIAGQRIGEALAGVLMTAHALPWLSIPVSLFIGTIGAVSVFKAVYVDRRELKCACVGGSSRVPLGFVSLTENLLMIGMALWMLAKVYS